MYPIIELWRFISLSKKIRFLRVFSIMIMAAITEVVSLGLLIPFLAALTDPSVTNKLVELIPGFASLPINSVGDLTLFLTLAFILATLFAAVIRIAMISSSIRLSSDIGFDLSVQIYKKTLNESYLFHVTNNSSRLINIVANKTSSIVSGAIMPMLNIVTSASIAAAILATLLLVAFKVTALSFTCFLFLYASIAIFSKRKILVNGEIIAKESDLIYKQLQEGFGGIREVILDGTQTYFCSRYESSEHAFRKAINSNMLISQCPRFIMEGAGMILIAAIAYALTRNSSPQEVSIIALLGGIALGAQRLLPLMQQIYASIMSIKGNSAALEDVLSLLRRQGEAYPHDVATPSLKFEEKIELSSISFSYPGRDTQVLKNISLTICKGKKYGIVGATGSGKSTLIDIIMGLLKPSSGQITLDDGSAANFCHQSWRSLVAHVPQDVYLFDGTIESNVALGVPKHLINSNRVREVCRHAQIAEAIESWPAGYDTHVGERGVQLSGGQKQRIGIARALYKQASILVLDEATSALDASTEEQVMDAIESLGQKITLIIIAHRITTLKKCNWIFDIKAGEVVSQSTYDDYANRIKSAKTHDLS
jgi:ATP-binding cassette subfamily B protein